MELIATLVPLVLTTNVLMAASKWLANGTVSRLMLRGALLIFSAGGLIISAAVNGTPVEVNEVTSLVTLGLQTILLALISHFSYKLIKS